MAELLIVLFVALLWVAAVAFGRDTRDGHDWFSRANAEERPRRLGD